MSKVTALIRLNGDAGSDRLALNEGEPTAAHAGLGRVWMLDAADESRDGADAPPGRSATKLASGGAGLRELPRVEVGSGTVFKAAVEVPGQPILGHASDSAGPSFGAAAVSGFSSRTTV